MSQDLPSLDLADRPEQAKRLWRAMTELATDQTPQMNLGRALALHRLNPVPQIEHRLFDTGYLVDTALNRLVSDLWPAIAGTTQGHYDLSDPLARHSYKFRQKISQHLRSTVNVLCLRHGNVSVQSRWWVRTEWLDYAPIQQFTLSEFDLDQPDVPEAELVRLRADNEQLRTKNEQLRTENKRLSDMLRAIGTDEGGTI